MSVRSVSAEGTQKRVLGSTGCGEPVPTHWHSSARARVNPRERPCTVTLRRMWRMIWPAVLLAGLLAGCSGGPGKGVSPEAPSITAASPPPTMGTPVRDGGLEFIVNGVRLGPTISSDHARYKHTAGTWLSVCQSPTLAINQKPIWPSIKNSLSMASRTTTPQSRPSC